MGSFVEADVNRSRVESMHHGRIDEVLSGRFLWSDHRGRIDELMIQESTRTSENAEIFWLLQHVRDTCLSLVPDRHTLLLI